MESKQVPVNGILASLAAFTQISIAMLHFNLIKIQLIKCVFIKQFPWLLKILETGFIPGQFKFHSIILITET